MFYNKVSFSSHPTNIPQGYHVPTSKKVIEEYAQAAMRAINTNGSVVWVSKKIGHNPNDWYGVPTLDNMDGLKRWLQRVGINISDFSDDTLLPTLRQSTVIAQKYLAKKWYYLPKVLQKEISWSSKEILWFMSVMSKYKNEVDIRASTIFLKVVRASFKNITTKDSRGNLMFNPLTWELQEKDKAFAKEVMNFFNSDAFLYVKDNGKFSKDSVIANGRSQKHGTDAEFTAMMDFKTLDSQILKTISQNDYDAAEAIQDRNRMQIEVNTESDMLKIALVMIESLLLKKGIKWEQKWWIFSNETIEWRKFQDSYITDHADLHHKLLLATIPTEKKKWNTNDRKEIKITSIDPSFEIQIVLKWNSNESGWNANPYYKMKADIDEEIILRWGYITKERILKHISKRLPELVKFWQNPDQKTPEKIFEHFVQAEKKLIPLYPQNYSIKEKIWKPLYTHTEFFTNKDFTSRWIKAHTTNLPFQIWHDSTGNFSPLIYTPSSPANP